jgi:hypothetical protein
VTDRLFTDVRRFAMPPGRPIGTERFERRPRRVTIGGVLRSLFGRPGAPQDTELLPAYLDFDPPRRQLRRTRGTI